jgi:sulfate permease, SulP family
VATARTLAAKNRYEVDANRELAGLGASSIAAGFSQAFPVSASNSRTALNDASGGTSQMALVAAAIVAVIAAFATPLIEPLPKAVLGVVVVAAGLGLFDFYGIVDLRRVRDAEAGLAVAALRGVLCSEFSAAFSSPWRSRSASSSTARSARTTRFSARPTTSTATSTSSALRHTSCRV